MTALNRRVFVAALALAAALAGAGTLPAQAGKSPTVTVIRFPDFWGSFAIWGATGSDRAGHIFFGVTSNDDRGDGSAHLFEFDPASGALADRGNVVAELERLTLRRRGETQMKIHSRIVIGADGLQYFASMDETGEAEDGSRLPTWGGHLWRRRAAGVWEHLLTTPEALIAVATGGPYVYALGYFNHVLYQFDTRTKAVRSATVGSVEGHVSRNFFADDRGHVFVPRIARAGTAATAALVEFDAALTELASQPLSDYFESAPGDSHGIVATVPDGSGGWYFTTGAGRLYHEQPAPSGPARVGNLGWFHPAGSRYPASLFRNSRSGTLYSAVGPSHNGTRTYDWVVRRADNQTTVAPLPFGEAVEFPAGANVYGSMTEDTAGRYYVVGSMSYKPFALQITPAEDERR